MSQRSASFTSEEEEEEEGDDDEEEEDDDDSKSEGDAYEGEGEDEDEGEDEGEDEVEGGVSSDDGEPSPMRVGGRGSSVTIRSVDFRRAARTVRRQQVLSPAAHVKMIERFTAFGRR